MERKELRKKLLSLKKNRQAIDREISKLEKQLTKELCPKGKVFCEPAYCLFQISDSCPFLKEWRKYSID